MIDASHHPMQKNIELTRQVVEYAHKYDVTVEGELGVLPGSRTTWWPPSRSTPADDVENFVKATASTRSPSRSHLARRQQVQASQCTRDANGVLVPPPLRFDILEEIERRIRLPIVLHAPPPCPKYVDMINATRQAGGRGRIPEEQLRRAAASAVCKVNIDSDGRLAMTAASARSWPRSR